MKRSANTDLVYGIRPVIEAIRSGKELDSVLIKKGLSGELYSELKELLRERGIRSQLVPAERFGQFGNKNHQGVVAYLSPIDFQPIEEVVAGVWDKGQWPFLLMVDRITDVRNFGAIVRTAECAGVHAVVFVAKGSARIGSDAIKTSAGALHHMTICRVNSLRSTIRFLQNSGIKVIAASEKAPKTYSQAMLKPPIALVLGSEDVGVSAEVLKIVDDMVSIPIKGNVQSLNVSVAAGILVYEAVRQQGI
ncbi:MAG TPA: 23S rRNA (guanosine(2251)-2'-O)-methyltransferase RlmB [Tenuifilaceae bacterium]|jgi:23S rRNA (guanosine2251-2'-O)-methyltransferase|nr:23S rRNA (guanosine(2251)-2'-O)-methyltransferase RlmB [Bacteroidales bacterium]MDI9517029.1 23S rRNA (guanosine(2251)-2'-O)-methyltransferase RlmB [Bacteroidota bacterium]NLH55473.1 23S rRNA (guanosine(2251)-2'-O)-methyltransferase RlmB [Rikenellaceae bacterium]OQC62689.1 MAG: 23S rRNA (guanosine-2'-O-)-methyltransferase RlmB [Bacteroidetes bacterium ADurb.Bin008]HNV81985.1 23S rRNA (guanosine(2251)-2'-O)-methyltransferase RlmB [Tenuifilaceae bacterium]